MALVRILIVAVVALLIYQWLRRRLFPPTAPPGAESDAPGDAARLVQCRQCGTWVPRGSAIREGGQTYCGQACRQEARAARE